MFFLVLSLLAIGCDNSENASNADPADPIIGTWKLAAITNNTIDFPLQSCERGTYYTFRATGAQITGEKITYHRAIQDCTPEPVIGRWGHKDDHYYIISNYNTQSAKWDNVQINESSLIATVVKGSVTTVLTWKKQ